MSAAAEKEDGMAKHPVTPCAVIPVRELLGELLLEVGEYESAADAFEQNLKSNPNRWNGIYGLNMAKQKSKL